MGRMKTKSSQTDDTVAIVDRAAGQVSISAATAEPTGALETVRRAATLGSAARLGLMIGARRLLVDLAEAGEIVPMPPMIVPVPLTKDWLLGVTNLRGSLYTVVDLRRFSGEGITDIGKETRLLSLSPALNFNATLVVSRMLGLRNTASMTALAPEQPPAFRPEQQPVSLSDLASAAPWLGHRFADADGQVWQELSLARLAATPDFLMIGR